MNRLVSRFGGLAVGLWIASAFGASLVPMGQQQFTDNNGAPLAGGQVCLYVPGTTTPKATWLDRAQQFVNTSPCVTLNSGGRAIIWGYGQYRQMVYDVNGNLFWDQVVSEYVSDQQNNSFNWASTSTGSANAQAISVSPAPPLYVAGQIFEFKVGTGLTNTGATTLNVNGLGAQAVMIASATGPIALTGGEIVQGAIIQVEYDGAEFQITGGSAGTVACNSLTRGLVPATGGGTANFLRADCTFAKPPGPLPLSVYTNTTAGAFSTTVPAGATVAEIEAWGAGGGGGFGSGTTTCASGGSAGAYGYVALAVTAGGTISGTIGLGGAAATGAGSGNAGGDTTVTAGASYVAGGGPGGLSEQSGSANSPLTATTSGAWQRIIIGQQGYLGFNLSNLVVSGQGGTAALGGPGGSGGGGGGASGTIPGAGGGGSGDSQVAGNGANGEVRITYH